jgi:molybdate transport system substrate-binding protein
VRHHRLRVAVWVAVAATTAALTLAACGSSSGSSSSGKSTPSTTVTAKVTGTATVSAAASLTEAFTEMGTGFEKVNPGATVTFNFGSSSTLATQIQQGAPADVFASADTTNVQTLSTAGLTDGAGQPFAKNQLEIVTKPGNPKRVTGLGSLATVGVVSLCGSTVPCGRYADQALTAADVTIPADRITRGVDAKATLAAVATGDAEAGIVYVTDTESAGSRVTGVAIPASQNVIATYPIVVLKSAAGNAVAQAFVDYVLSSAGQATLRSFGFVPPTAS